MIRGDMVKPGAVVIDVGINRIIDQKTGKTKLVGDVDFEGKAFTAVIDRLLRRSIERPGLNTNTSKELGLTDFAG